MDRTQIDQIRRFNRLITRRLGALDDGYLSRGRPLSEARLIFEIGATGADASALRNRLGLDSGYLSRLLQSLKTQGLIEVGRQLDDGRRRSVQLTREGVAELAIYDDLSDQLASSLLDPLEAEDRRRLTAAMSEVERLIRAGSVQVAVEPADGADARGCLDQYFRELTERFETGFDPAEDKSAEVDDVTPPAGMFVVARLDGDSIGCGALKRVDATTGEIKRVWTARSARRLGVARKILRALENGGREMGMTVLRLDTNRALTEAHAFYRREGFREVDRFGANPYAHHWFSKPL
jgi:DNA-binding MarR family transcriptional regulator/GNAT superfamily N-acetyltransferase